MTGVRSAAVFHAAGVSAVRIMTRWIPATLTVSIRNRNALFRTIRFVTASISSPLIFVSRDVCRSNSGYDIERTAVRTLSCSGLKIRHCETHPPWPDVFYISLFILPQVTELFPHRLQSLSNTSDICPLMIVFPTCNILFCIVHTIRIVTGSDSHLSESSIALCLMKR